MRVTEDEAKQLVCPLSLGNTDGCEPCIGKRCMAFTHDSSIQRYDESADRWEQVELYVCGLIGRRL